MGDLRSGPSIGHKGQRSRSPSGHGICWRIESFGTAGSGMLE